MMLFKIAGDAWQRVADRVAAVTGIDDLDPSELLLEKSGKGRRARLKVPACGDAIPDDEKF
jgi:hypothetical protein